jgi:hypothetical protein
MTIIVTQEMIDRYLNDEHNGISEETYIKGYMEDGITEDDAVLMLADNAYDHYMISKKEIKTETGKKYQVCPECNEKSVCYTHENVPYCVNPECEEGNNHEKNN